MERMTAWTRQGHGSTQASASLFQANKKWLLLMDFCHLGPIPLLTYSINERMAQQAADTRDPTACPVIFVLG